nr:hypothetical protein [Tanacetum cinerariifolium]
MSDNTKKAQCIHCLHFFWKDFNSTLKNHISHPHCEELKRAAKQGQSSMSRDGSLFVYNSDVLRGQFAGLVIQRGLPFNHFDDKQTMRVFQKHLQPKYNHVSRTTLIRDAIKLWVAAKQVIIDGFLKLNNNVNLTTDVWSAPHGVPGSYICVTAHLIEPVTWKMMKRIIAFEDFPAPHSGSALAKTLRNVFVNFNLKNKIMSITLDNTSNNTSVIGKLKLKYDPPMEEFLIESISTNLDFFDDSHVTKAKKWFTDSFEGLYNIYYTKFGNPTTTESSSGAGGSSSTAGHGNQVTSLLSRLKEHKNKKARSDPSLSSEYERYVHSGFVTHLQTTEFETFDVLGFWKAKETTFPVLSRMAMNILSVQATSIASESAFSTSGMVLSIRRTRLTLASLEMYFQEDILDAEVQANEAIPLSYEEIALDSASSEGSMYEPGSGGEEPRLRLIMVIMSIMMIINCRL